MLAFVHMHKCAGTTVVRSARSSGLRLPAKHKNGNLRTDEDSNLRYATLSRAELDVIMADLKADGVEFLAFEFDMPPVSYLRDHGVELFTVLRHPLKRALSNFRYAKTRGNAPPTRSFRDFMNKDSTKDGPLSRSSNYYTRKLCQLTSNEPVTEAHLQSALEALASFRSVVPLESGALEESLVALGMTKVRTKRVGTEVEAKVELQPEHTEVTGEDEAWFLSENLADMALYEHVATAPPPIAEGAAR